MSVRAFNWVATVVGDSRLNQSQRSLLWALAHHHHDKTGACFPAVATLAGMAGISERKATEHLGGLADLGLIHVNKRTVRGRQRSNQYDLFGTFRADGSVTPKPALRGDKKSTPKRVNRGVTAASPDREEIPNRGNPSEAFGENSPPPTHLGGRA